MSLLDVGCVRARSPSTSPAASRRGRFSASTARRRRSPRRAQRPRGFRPALRPRRNLRPRYRAGDYDVVHAHQVLQRLVDPIAALVDLLRSSVARRLVAARDGDYTTMTCVPQDPLLDRWQELYQRVTRAQRGRTRCRRRLAGRARAPARGCARLGGSSCLPTPDARTWSADLWADRVTQSRFAEQALGRGSCDPRRARAIAAAFLRWAQDPGASFAMLHGEVRCTAPGDATRTPGAAVTGAWRRPWRALPPAIRRAWARRTRPDTREDGVGRCAGVRPASCSSYTDDVHDHHRPDSDERPSASPIHGRPSPYGRAIADDDDRQLPVDGRSAP